MTGILTNSFKSTFANSIISDIANTNHNYYIGFARSAPWDDDFNPPDADLSVNASIYDLWNSMLFGKKLSPSDLSYVTKKYTWSSGTVYDFYSHLDANLYNKPFYVINQYGRVYKCLYNNNGAASTIEPNDTVVKTHFKTSDGYIWKYLFRINSLQTAKFAATEYMPVVSDNSVAINAEDGAIHVIALNAGGQNYISTEGYVEQVIPTGLTYNIAKISNTGASIISGAYIKSAFYVSAGSGEGLYANVVDYNVNSSGSFVTTSTDVASLDSTSYYQIAPKIVITGTGQGAIAVATVNNTIGSIYSVDIISRGELYYKATASVVANIEFGSGANVYPIISPPGGHGSNVFDELGADIVGISLDTVETDDIPTWASYRQICLISNPTAFANNTPYRETTFKQLDSFTITNVSDPIPADDVIVGYNSGATATVINMTTTDLYVYNITGSFQLGETVTGIYTGIQCTLSAINTKDLVPYVGKILYYNNFQAIQRSDSPSERVKLFVKY